MYTNLDSLLISKEGPTDPETLSREWEDGRTEDSGKMRVVIGNKKPVFM
jgi:hypothetical protein